MVNAKNTEEKKKTANLTNKHQTQNLSKNTFRRRASRTLGNSKQVAQLSQRDRATLRVIEYVAKSLKVTQAHSK